MAKKITVRVCPNTLYGWDISKPYMGNSKEISNYKELNPKENEDWEAELEDGKFKLLNRVNK